MVGPRAKRAAVRVVREEVGLSERRACGLIGMHRGSWRYRRRERNEGALRARLRELAAERPRFGYRRLYIFLRREKAVDGTLRWLVNHKRAYRLYREEGLAVQNQVALHFIERGKPTQNAFIESFNGKFRDECLNPNWFVDLRHARELIEAWRVDYNTVRPHSSLRYRTPEEFAASVAPRPASPPTPVVSLDPAWAGSDVQE